jgi:hypothetical protein
MAVMRGIVGQTAVGAVEMEEYAKQMGRIAANAHMMQGSADTNIMKMSALAQFVVEAGGGTGGADAARSLVSLMTTPQKGARAKAFAKHGVDLYTDKSKTLLRPIDEIIKDSISKTGGSLPGLNEMWMDTLGAKSVKGLSSAYRDASGATSGTAAEKDAAGRKAIDAALDKYMKAQLDAATEQKNIADHQKSIAAKAQDFQNNLDRIVSVTATQLIPPLERAAPSAIKIAEAFAKVAGWAAENPGKAILAAFVMSIARAGVESRIREQIERWFAGPGARRMPGGSPLGAGPGADTGGGGPLMLSPPGQLNRSNPRGFRAAIKGGGIGAGFNALVGGAMGYSAGAGVDAMAGSQSSGLFSMIGAGAGAGAAYGPWGALIGGGLGALGAIPKLLDEAIPVLKGGGYKFGEKVAGGSDGDAYDRMVAEYTKTHPGAAPGAGGAAGPPKIEAQIDHTQFSKAVGHEIRAALAQGVRISNINELRPPKVSGKGRDEET